MSERREELMAAIERAAMKGIEKAAAKPSTEIQTAQVAQSKPQIKNEVAKAVAASPEVQHVTNTETHWYQQRSKWGAIIGPSAIVLAAVLKVFGIEWGITAEQIEAFSVVLAAIGVAVGAVFSLLAGISTRPMFSGKEK